MSCLKNGNTVSRKQFTEVEQSSWSNELYSDCIPITCMGVHCPKKPERTSNSPELEWQTLLSYSICWEPNSDPLQQQRTVAAFNCRSTSPDPIVIHFCRKKSIKQFYHECYTSFDLLSTPVAVAQSWENCCCSTDTRHIWEGSKSWVLWLAYYSFYDKV